jgi:phage repressor protein C with HTH and peptisase S24 domain
VTAGALQDPYRQRVLELIAKHEPKTTMKEASKAIGMNHAYLHQFIYKKVPKHLGETARSKLARYLHVGERELIAPDQLTSAASFDAQQDGFISVPFYDVKASARHGTVVDRPRVLHCIAFRKDWLKRITAASVEDLAVISVVGDSMEPNLSADDTVLVDLTNTQPGADGIYVLLYDEGLRVKRLRVDPVRRIVRITSDNPSYDPIDNVRPEELRIFGRVVWPDRQI